MIPGIGSGMSTNQLLSESGKVADGVGPFLGSIGVDLSANPFGVTQQAVGNANDLLNQIGTFG